MLNFSAAVSVPDAAAGVEKNEGSTTSASPERENTLTVGLFLIHNLTCLMDWVKGYQPFVI